MGEHFIGRHKEVSGDVQSDLSFDQILDSMSPREIRARLRAAAREEQHMRERQEKKEPTFDEMLNSMTPRQVRAHIRSFAKEEEKHRQEESVKLAKQQPQRDFKPADEKLEPEQAPIKMTYDKASDSYVTEDGYILPAGPKIERLSGYMLQDQLHNIAEFQEQQAKERALPARHPVRPTFQGDPIIDLPNSNLDYRAVASSVPVRSLYGPGSSSCSEFSISVDGQVLGMSSGSINLYDKQNDQCRLAQTVQQACSLPELLAADAQRARNVKEMLMKTDAAAQASDFCADTVAAVQAEKKRLAI